jgi:hypothetical protein
MDNGVSTKIETNKKLEIVGVDSEEITSSIQFMTNKSKTFNKKCMIIFKIREKSSFY